MSHSRTLAAAGSGLCLALLAVQPADAQINLKIANYFPPPSQQSKVVEAFGQALESRSGGKIKVQYFAGGSLVPAPAMYKGIESGIADIGYSHVYYTPGRMAVSEGVGLPIGMPTGWVAVHVGHDFYEKFQPKEFGAVKVLTLHANGPSLVISKRPVAKLEDLKGVTIRAPGIAGDVVKALGGTPTPTPMPEVYDSISKGVNEGVYAPYEVLKTFRFAEVAKSVTVSWQIGASFPFYLGMNQKSYDGLPPDLKKVVDSVSAEWVEQFARMWNNIDLEGKAHGAENGVSYHELSPQEAARWQKAMDPVIDNWVKTMTGKGHQEAEVRGWIAFLRERIKHWTTKQIEAKIPAATGPMELRPETLGKK